MREILFKAKRVDNNEWIEGNLLTQELRIGNLVLHEPTIDDWEEIIVSAGSIIQCDINPNSYTGIPITEEWLLKLGFESNKSWENEQDKVYYTLDLSKDKYEDLSLLSSYMDVEIYVELFPYESFKFKYVHQLQNLHFALTGTELKIKEK